MRKTAEDMNLTASAVNRRIRHYVMQEQAIGFEIPIGLKAHEDNPLVFRPFSDREAAPGSLILGQLRGRILPVPSARCVMQLATTLHRREP